jgi:pimeloyl-ACP methyl ester carboxylesterase
VPRSTRRSWTRRAAIGVFALVVVILGGGWIFEHLRRLTLPTSYPPPGDLVSVNGRNLHLNCTGDGEPVVLLESGFGPYGSLGWFAVQPGVSELTKTCSYDRAGYMWSEPGEEPRDGVRAADELHSLLQAASVPPPYVLVGHSGGGVLVRIYDAQFPGEVAGFVFVDSSHPEQEQRLPRPSGGSTPPRGMLTVLTETGLWRLVVPLFVPPRPPNLTPREQMIGDTILAYWPLSMHALAAEISSVDQTARQVPVPGDLTPRPIIVLSRSDFAVELGDPEGLIEETRTAWMEMQSELAELSSNSRHRIVPNTSHEVQIDAPEAVIGAISEVVNTIRTTGRLRASGN